MTAQQIHLCSVRAPLAASPCVRQKCPLRRKGRLKLGTPHTMTRSPRDSSLLEKASRDPHFSISLAIHFLTSVGKAELLRKWSRWPVALTRMSPSLPLGCTSHSVASAAACVSEACDKNQQLPDSLRRMDTSQRHEEAEGKELPRAELQESISHTATVLFRFSKNK